MSEATSFEHRNNPAERNGTSGGQDRSNNGRTADRTQATLNETTQRVADQGRQVQHDVQAVAENFTAAFEKSLRDQPYATLGMAAAMGFVLGALWKS
jgi:ElaB/YqjD/DUF883 family membrane-anchored ribosome-binding protein